MTFKELSHIFADIEATSSRNDMTVALADLFKKASKNEIKPIMYMLQGRVEPAFVKSDFGLGERMIAKAAMKALNLDSAVFNKRYKKIGDVGLTVEEFKKEISSFLERDLSVEQVYDELVRITKASGEGSQDEKMSILADLMQTLDATSCRYIARIPAQTLRLGFSDMTILDALSWMLKGDKSARKDIQKAYQVRPDLGLLGEVLKEKGLHGLESIEPEVGTPILMMKAQRLPTPKDIYDKLKSAVIEPKYDGFRLQAHVKKSEKDTFVRLFSRGLDDVTYMYPDVVEGLKQELEVDSAIIEGEAIGFDEYSGSFLPFQETVQRKRKHDIKEKVKEIPLKMFAFEMLYLNGRSLLDEPLEKRVVAMRKAIKHTGDIHKDTLLLSPEDEMNSEKDVHSSFDEAIEKGLEGIMVKKKDGLYQPGARGWNWIKYKRSYSSKIDDTIDCLVMGYDKGKGKRAGFGIGAFLVGVYDEKNDIFKTVAKIGTGLSDDQWKTLFERAEKIRSVSKPALYDVGSVDVDEWIKPEIIVEIKADELTKSPMHSARLALRFPRLTRFRDDKTPEDATSLKEIQAMFKSQST